MKHFCNDMINRLENTKRRSCWDNGVKNYAIDLMDDLANNAAATDEAPKTWVELEALLLNGAKDWKQYSRGGSALCYDGDIAAALCTPSELKRCKNGALPPNSQEDWLDVQARALYQAANMIHWTFGNIKYQNTIIEKEGCISR